MTTILSVPTWACPDTDLTGSTVLVVGGAGGVGEGVTRALLAAGATVVATARSAAKLKHLSARLAYPNNLVVRTLDLLNPGLAGTVAALVEQYGPLHSIGISVADWGQQGRKRLIDLSDEEWDVLLARNETTVFRAYRALIPALAPTGMIAQLNGMSADIPFPGADGPRRHRGSRQVDDPHHRRGTTRRRAASVRDRPRRHPYPPPQVRRHRQPRLDPATDVGTHVAELVAGTSPLTGSTLHYFIDRVAGPQPGPTRV